MFVNKGIEYEEAVAYINDIINSQVLKSELDPCVVGEDVLTSLISKLSRLHDVPILDTLKKKGDQYTLRIGYVSAENIGIDEKGNLVDPTPDQADFFQIFHVQKNGEGWMLTAVEDTSR